MPIRCEWSFLCERADADTNSRLNAFGIASGIVTHLPSQVSFTLVARISGDPDVSMSMDVAISTPSGSRLGKPEPRTVNMLPSGFLDSTMRLNNIPLLEYGTYVFAVILNGDEASTIRLPVTPPQSVVH